MPSPKRDALATWFLEVSALLAVFPALEAALRDGRMRWGVVVGGAVVSLFAAVVGLYLKK